MRGRTALLLTFWLAVGGSMTATGCDDRARREMEDQPVGREGEGEAGGADPEGQGAEGSAEGEGEGTEAFCADADDDGYGDGPGCAGLDCDDVNAAIHPAAAEDCQTPADDDCDGEANEGCGRLPDCLDEDRDGFGVGAGCLGEDCDDSNAGSYPGARERCDDRLDNDCNSRTDEGCGTGGRGTDCSTMYECMGSCPDNPCENDCEAHGSSEARRLLAAMYRCFQERCSDSSDWEFQWCAETECASAIDGCLGGGY